MYFENKQILKLLSKGLFAVNKVKHKTSVEVLEKLKEIIINDVKPKYRPHPLKIGHGGTLDQTATGVLVVGVGWGCKALPKLLQGGKKYLVTGCLGVSTDTYNETGCIVQEKKYDHITQEMLETALQKFEGNILQTPPKFSALKVHGRRIADLTRAGVKIDMKPRPVTCHSAQCIEFSPPHFKIVVSCGGGFYVRSLVHDLGIALDTCAHVTSLHRTQHGLFTEDDMLEPSQWTIPHIVDAIWIASQSKVPTYSSRTTRPDRSIDLIT